MTLRFRKLTESKYKGHAGLGSALDVRGFLGAASSDAVALRFPLPDMEPVTACVTPLTLK